MKRMSIRVLQVVIILIAVVTLTLMIRFPLTEGRAKNLDLFSIYSDPFILYGYASSVAFFVALYKAFRLLGYIRQNKASSPASLKAAKSIKYCAILLVFLIAMAGLYISIFHNKNDDPAGFLAMCIVTVFISVAVAVATTVFGKRVRNTTGNNAPGLP